MLLSPSLLSSDYGHLADELKALEKADLKWVHWDVMDGQFVPNITLGAPIIKCLRKESNLFFDVHLMVDRPERFLVDFAEAGADLICVHAEAGNHLNRTIQEIKKLGKQAGVALNPHTPLNVLDYILPELDLVLIMSVNPGFGGQKFIPYTYAKVRELKERINKLNLKTLIQIDGGVDLTNAKALVEAGADVLVSGSAFFNFPPYGERVKAFYKAIE
ncbi:ribulose-phosphate 3-epimerase [Desulfovibrio litoralis]|uniref:Ribulose-phosphate 3-epimerase n=1 Tax=Desulfovibrio litoralis DSM 11393 TaxID=1121455 RepID=A0A1M7SBK6_9BACT|nr:ribulose-phosphate 3-epimerase [Desulfovibrio litoralis]SHN55835.1 ribulose-5-phosphate 3-epimerase [Desulfovibrio litoralis DSM 11393]